MKKNKYIILATALLMATLSVSAQHEEPVLLSVSYQFTHVYDTDNRANPYQRGMVLHIGETNSKYTDGDAEAAYKAQQKAAKEISASGAPMRVVTGKLAATVRSINRDIIFQMPAENKMITEATLGSGSFIMEAPMNTIQWKIEKETRQIDKYTCQKATGSFAGRKYIAWFTTELPFKNGPWKLCGLPGLILEATDDKNEVSFIFKEITKGEPDEKTTSTANRAVKVDDEAFARAKKQYDDDPAGAAQARFPNYTEPISIFYELPSGKMLSGDEAKAALKNHKKLINNPLELKGKK